MESSASLRPSNPLVLFVSRVLEPHVFLVIRLLGDLAASTYLLLVHDYLLSLWFFVVAVATGVSDRKAFRQRPR